MIQVALLAVGLAAGSMIALGIHALRPRRDPRWRCTYPQCSCNRDWIALPPAQVIRDDGKRRETLRRQLSASVLRRM